MEIDLIYQPIQKMVSQLHGQTSIERDGRVEYKDEWRKTKSTETTDYKQGHQN